MVDLLFQKKKILQWFLWSENKDCVNEMMKQNNFLVAAGTLEAKEIYSSFEGKACFQDGWPPVQWFGSIEAHAGSRARFAIRARTISCCSTRTKLFIILLYPIGDDLSFIKECIIVAVSYWLLAAMFLEMNPSEIGFFWVVGFGGGECSVPRRKFRLLVHQYSSNWTKRLVHYFWFL